MTVANCDGWQIEARDGYAFIRKFGVRHLHDLGKHQLLCSIPLPVAFVLARLLLNMREERIVLDVREAMDAG